MAIIAAIARGTTVLTLILLVLAVMKKSVFVAGLVLFFLLKFIVVSLFISLLISIICAIVRDRCRRKREAEGL